MDDLNERAFALYQAQDWQGAIDVAKQAVSLDNRSWAAWFNLGRAQLSAGQAKEAMSSIIMAHNLLSEAPSVGVEFYLATAQEAAGYPAYALGTLERAQKLWPDDPDLGRAIADLQQQHDLAVLGPADSIDVDGDRRPDLIEVTDQVVRITAADGKVLLESPIEGSQSPPELEFYPLRGSTPLVRMIDTNSCISGRLNSFYWYDRAAMAMKSVEGGGVCLTYDYLGDGRFEAALNVGEGKEQVLTERFQAGQWVKEGETIRPRGK